MDWADEIADRITLEWARYRQDHGNGLRFPYDFAVLDGKIADALRAERKNREAERSAATFGFAVLEESREWLSDIDGGWLQDKAEQLGLLERITVTESCGEECVCAEVGFPTECLRYPKQIEEAIAAYRKAVNDG